MKTFYYICSVKRILAKKIIRDFYIKFPDSKIYLETWYETIKSASWNKPSDLKMFYTQVSILKNSRVVFSIKGNDYRLVAKIEYRKQWIFIRFFGTHKEYDKIDANTI